MSKPNKIGAENAPNRGRGRPKGAKNKLTIAKEEAAEKAAKTIAKAIPGAFQGNSHAYLMSIYKDPKQATPVRIDAAKAALPFEKPRLAAVEHTGAEGGPIQSEVKHTLDEKSAEIITNLVK